MKAVHFGAGNIGRGFIGAVLQDAGYFVTFADVNDSIVEQLNKSTGYEVIELGDSRQVHRYTNYRALNSITDAEKLSKELSEASIITASVGATILPRIVPAIVSALKIRNVNKPLVIMACENAVNATDILESELRKLDDCVNVHFANTAVDRIVPVQSHELAPDVEVETFCEWVIETGNLGGVDLKIPGATFVTELQPFIERKLYTVNTAHCTVAYVGQSYGFATIAAALKDPRVLKQTQEVLAETSQFLVTKFGFDPIEHQKYVEKTLKRISNPVMDDQVERVGRQPLRKLSRFERLIGPAAGLAEQGGNPKSLLEVIGDALRFTEESDEEAMQLHSKLKSLTAADFAKEVCGITPADNLFELLVTEIHLQQAREATPRRLAL